MVRIYFKEIYFRAMLYIFRLKYAQNKFTLKLIQVFINIVHWTLFIEHKHVYITIYAPEWTDSVQQKIQNPKLGFLTLYKI